MRTSWLAFGAVSLVALVSGCTPGYINTSDLERRNQGPASCAKACQDIGMTMTAMVLVGDTVPGCVCQPAALVPPGPAAPAPAAPATTAPSGSPPPPAPASNTTPARGAAASAGGYVLIAAAAAARSQQEHRQSHHTHHTHTR
jgi:hypothetical protein